MKTLGLIGGMTWSSTVEYYKYINRITNQKLGGDHSAKCILRSLDFSDIVENNRKNDMDGIAAMLADAARNLQNAGADAIVICANTMHMHADVIQRQIGIPIIHLVVATANEITRRELKTVALLGTKYTMELDFYKTILAEYEIVTMIPGQADRDFIHATIYKELARGKFLSDTKQHYLDIIGRLAADGAEGVILGCTEIPLLITSNDSPIPSFDTTYIHASAAVEFALSE